MANAKNQVKTEAEEREGAAYRALDHRDSAVEARVEAMFDRQAEIASQDLPGIGGAPPPSDPPADPLAAQAEALTARLEAWQEKRDAIIAIPVGGGQTARELREADMEIMRLSMELRQVQGYLDEQKLRQARRARSEAEAMRIRHPVPVAPVSVPEAADPCGAVFAGGLVCARERGHESDPDAVVRGTFLHWAPSIVEVETRDERRGA